MKIYTDYFFAQESSADEWMEILEEDGAEALIDSLCKNFYEPGESSETPPWGTRDVRYEIDGWILSVNYGLPYVGLCKVEDTGDEGVWVKPNMDYQLLGTSIRLDKNKSYLATPATNQPDHEKLGLIFVGEVLLERGEYTLL